MDRNKIIDVLKNFISGQIQVGDLYKVIDDWLYELRRDPDLTPDQELLSKLELYLHEAQEGYRAWEELYDLAVSIIQRNLGEINVRTVTLPSTTTSNAGTVTHATPVRDYPLPV